MRQLFIADGPSHQSHHGNDEVAGGRLISATETRIVSVCPRTVLCMETPQVPSADGPVPEDGLDRLRVYTYLTVPERALHLAVMRVFTGTLLADLSAHDVAERLSEQGWTASIEQVAGSLDRLADWGALLPSSRPVRATSIREYQRARSRYQLSTLGERVQRQADELIAAADTAREVSRELLALVAQGLAELAGMADRPGGVPTAEGIGLVSSLFAQFGTFADSVRDFYAYLGQVIFRYDLDSGEFAGFKELLLDYAETITDEVSRCAPQIEQSLDRLWPALPGILDRFDQDDRGLAALAEAEVRVERSRGRRMADWEGLRAWFFAEGEQASQVGQLRDATLRALQALLANAKRMIRSSTGELSRRRDLLTLASWFDQADDATAHDLFVAAFGLYPARHLGVASEDREIAASASWWYVRPVDVPRSLTTRGSRAPRGRTAAAEDYDEQREVLLRQAAAEAEREQTAAVELRAAAGRLDQVRLSGPAIRLLMDLLAHALASASPGFTAASSEDQNLRIRLRLLPAPDHHTLVRSVDGDLTIAHHTVELGTTELVELSAEVGT